MLDGSNSPLINLTVVQSQGGGSPASVQVKAWQLLTYDQQIGFTRLRLCGGRSLEVKESTDEIDRLLRLAAGQTTTPLSVSGKSAAKKLTGTTAGVAGSRQVPTSLAGSLNPDRSTADSGRVFGDEFKQRGVVRLRS